MTLLSSVAPVEETPIDTYLAEQAGLTAVERFAQRHPGESVPGQARYYRDLIPLERPHAGQQYAFEVDLDACTGCKACVAACHSLNGLDDGESWRSVTLLRSAGSTRPLQQAVTAACHHCVQPACLSGCPVDAYQKDPVTGIVSHLDDQCIGCSYCTLTCPYEVPVFNRARGIVRKCDMCQGRLADGEAPACVQACPNGAITVAVVDTNTAVTRAAEGPLTPGAPSSAITVPTTVYRSATGRVDALGATPQHATGPARAHPPLAVMLVLTQLSVGTFVTDLLVHLASGRRWAGPPRALDAVLAAAAGLVALGASVLHLGRPRYSYRAVIGLRHSWLSREVVAFAAFTGLLAPYAALRWLGPPVAPAVMTVLGGAAAACGVAGVACSVLIYTTTRRPTWRPRSVSTRFGLTCATCGLAVVTWASLVTPLIARTAAAGHPTIAVRRIPVAVLCVVLAVVMLAKLAGEAAVFRHLWRGSDDAAAHSARLMAGQLVATTSARFVAGACGGIALPLLVAATAPPGLGGPSWLGVALTTLALTGVVTGELLERSLFFTASSPPR